MVEIFFLADVGNMGARERTQSITDRLLNLGSHRHSHPPVDTPPVARLVVLSHHHSITSAAQWSSLAESSGPLANRPRHCGMNVRYFAADQALDSCVSHRREYLAVPS